MLPALHVVLSGALLAVVTISQSGCRLAPTAAPQHTATPQRIAPPPDYTYRDNIPLSIEDRRAIEVLVRQLTDEPILRVSADSDGYADVDTGIVHGPLNGGGHIFKFAKRNGKWEHLPKEDRNWVS